MALCLSPQALLCQTFKASLLDLQALQSPDSAVLFIKEPQQLKARAEFRYLLPMFYLDYCL